MDYFAGKYEVAVVGAGHAGIEAGLAAARLGCRTAVFTMNLDWIGNLPCNPSIGGTGKGHLVREIDALGGEMGRAADASFIQSRMLNRGKGPAVHSLRAQIDRRAYSQYMKHVMELQPGLDMYQAEIVDLTPTKDDRWRMTTQMGAVYDTATIVLATGTFLGGRIHVGDVSFDSGPDSMFPSTRLIEAIRRLNLPVRRFKTGTPARVLRQSIDFSKLEEQPGDDPVVAFSFDTEQPGQNRAACHITWTNAQTKEIVQKNLQRSALYGGEIEGVGPRHCPSIEDKIVRFSEKERHQVFIEPCGLETEEMYLQGVSTSLPEDVQVALYRTIAGLENVHILRPAYAIEYDCIDPLVLQPTLEIMGWPGLFGAGQFNGSSGYEEAAAQGLVAGVNAARLAQGRGPFVLTRDSSYMGTLIDDLVTKGCSDPYRMMTSRCEYRLILRQDNADQRLMPVGYALGLLSPERYRRFEERQRLKEEELGRVRSTVLPPSEELNKILVSRETTPVNTGVRLEELLKRPQIRYADLTVVDKSRPVLPDRIFEQVEIETKYDGYIRRQQAQIDEQKRLEKRLLPDDIEYTTIRGLRLEAREKLAQIRPRSVGQASRISGVTPADIAVLLIWLEKNARQAKGGENA